MNAPIPPDQTQDPDEAFIARWQRREGGQERANYALYLSEMWEALGLPHPDSAEARRRLLLKSLSSSGEIKCPSAMQSGRSARRPNRSPLLTGPH
jgi:hypothetical protein